MLEGLKPGAVVINMSTVSLEATKRAEIWSVPPEGGFWMRPSRGARSLPSKAPWLCLQEGLRISSKRWNLCSSPWARRSFNAGRFPAARP